MRLLNMTKAPIVVVSSMADQVISSVFLAGASGFVPKHSHRDVFQKAIEALRKGERFVPEGCILSDEKGMGEMDGAIKRISSLTNQQVRILQYLCQGKLNKQIAYDLSIAETTVKAHVIAIMRKLGVQSRTQAVLMANQASFNALKDNV